VKRTRCSSRSGSTPVAGRRSRPDHGDYPAIWTQTVNRQLKQSAFARQFLAGASVDDGPDWLAKTDEGIAYAREMGWRPDSFLRHAEDVGDQVGRYVPTPELRTKLLEGKVTHADLRQGCARSDGPSGGARRGARAGARPVRDLEGCAERARRTCSSGSARCRPTCCPATRSSTRCTGWKRNGSRTSPMTARAKPAASLGEEDLADIASKARRFALNQSQDLLYDLAEKSHLAHMLRFVAPFYMAWQEVLTRWAGIAVDNPAFVARMRQVWDAPEKAGLVSDEHGRVVDEHGQRDRSADRRDGEGRRRPVHHAAVLDPGSADARQGPVQQEVAEHGAAGHARFGPPVQIPVNEIVKNKPDLEKSVKFILPFGASQSTLQLLLPGTCEARPTRCHRARTTGSTRTR
jgi:hypothetical protein